MLSLLAVLACTSPVPVDTGAQADTAAPEPATWWLDSDEDGFGDPARPVEAAARPDGHADNDRDCDDADPAVHPGATELCNGYDDDCDGLADDEDVEIPADAPAWFPDLDGDGWAVSGDATWTCEAPPDSATQVGDCDDSDPAISPSATEVCNGIDDDCDDLVDGADDDLDASTLSTWWVDVDQDGYGNFVESTTAQACAAPSDSYAAESGDCDDALESVHPGAEDTPCDGVDADCDGWDDGCSLTGERSLDEATMLVYGETAGMGTGLAVLLADLTGSGVDDVVVASPGASDRASYAGRISIFDELISFDPVLESAAPHTVTGGDQAVALAGRLEATDADGDSFLDLVAVDLGSIQGREGTAWLFSGPLSGSRTLDDAALGIVADAGSGLGLGVAVAGDADGDDVPELLLGGPDASTAWLVELDGDGDVGDAPVAISGNRGTELGASGGLGDIDGDGLIDAALGAPQVGATYTGAVFVVLSVAEAGRLSARDADLVVEGTGDYDLVGTATLLRDLDGDGRDDLAIGATGVRSHAGAAYLFYGPGTGTLRTTLDADASFETVYGSSYLGTHLGAADLDGDEQLDLLITATGLNSVLTASTYNVGGVLGFLGPLEGVLDEADADLRLEGEDQLDEAGLSLAVGDADGNGREDVLLGSRYGDVVTYTYSGTAGLVLNAAE